MKADVEVVRVMTATVFNAIVEDFPQCSSSELLSMAFTLTTTLCLALLERSAPHELAFNRSSIENSVSELYTAIADGKKPN